mgnify:FL=1
MSLTTHDIVAAGLEILDNYGLEDLSMRRLAQLLDVKASALYWHVANKQTLLAAMADEILGEEGQLTPTDDGGELARELLGWAHALRSKLLAHRDGAELVSSAMSVGLVTTDPSVQLASFLQECGGCDSQTARAASQALTHLVVGHVMDEQARRQLFELNVIDTFDGEAQEIEFDVGVRLLVTGIRGASCVMKTHDA